jgi:hypothetical protein
VSIIKICKENAIKYSKEICIPKKGNFFPEYIDWADHIATDHSYDYQYHLNKAATDIEKLVKIFETFIPEKYFSDWKDDWYEVTLASAWVHDIGMIADRDDHGTKSAEIVLKNNDSRFNFNAVDIIDRIKIAILCIKHNRDWNTVIQKMNTLLSNDAISQFNSFFDVNNKPKWALDLSAKFLSTADSLRYRGQDLKNNLRNSFSLCTQCDRCKNIYHYPNNICSVINCKDVKLDTKAFFHHPLHNNTMSSKEKLEFALYEKFQDGYYQKVSDPITNKQNIRILVRDNNQMFTCGDILLSQVNIMDKFSWFNELTQNHINRDDIDDLISDDYRTVYLVTLDSDNPETALFTFSEYITTFIAKNLVIYYPITNYVILHITISKNIGFVEYLNMLVSDNAIFNTIQSSFHRWKDEYDHVLPVEIDNKKLKEIVL